MNLLDIERREKEVEARFRTYQNVFKTPYIAGLPMTMFFYFCGCCFFILFIIIGLILTGLWPVAIIFFLLIVAIYFIMKELVARFGVNFIDKLMAFYTMNTFNEVRINGFVKHLMGDKKNTL